MTEDGQPLYSMAHPIAPWLKRLWMWLRPPKLKGLEESTIIAGWTDPRGLYASGTVWLRHIPADELPWSVMERDDPHAVSVHRTREEAQDAAQQYMRGRR